MIAAWHSVDMRTVAALTIALLLPATATATEFEVKAKSIKDGDGPMRVGVTRPAARTLSRLYSAISGSGLRRGVLSGPI